MIDFKHVTKTYKNGTKALNDVSLHIDKGEFVFILGASGAGKSTFLKTLMREELPTSGSVKVNGIDLISIKPRKIPYFRRTLGIVFQDFRLIPTMTVYDNVAFAMYCTGARAKEISRRVAYALSLVGLSQKARNYPNELSGGEQQRVALARALVNKAEIIIADEPTGNIDPEMSREIVDLLNHLNKNNGTTIVMVTHEHELIKQYNKRVITIKDGCVVSDTAHPEIAAGMQNNGEVNVASSAGFYHPPVEKVEIENFLQSYGSADDQFADISDGAELAGSNGADLRSSGVSDASASNKKVSD
ncbi:MAG: cell division ATP-binding protein FtsE [Clostridia bacterium]|nr:cell division ATP-binding protein FtsE [Clostridia bacterium]